MSKTYVTDVMFISHQNQTCTKLFIEKKPKPNKTIHTHKTKPNPHKKCSGKVIYNYLKISTDIYRYLQIFWNISTFRTLLRNLQSYYLSNNSFNIIFKQNFLETFCFAQCLALFLNFLTPKSTFKCKTSIYYIKFLSVSC